MTTKNILVDNGLIKKLCSMLNMVFIKVKITNSSVLRIHFTYCQLTFNFSTGTDNFRILQLSINLQVLFGCKIKSQISYILSFRHNFDHILSYAFQFTTIFIAMMLSESKQF